MPFRSRVGRLLFAVACVPVGLMYAIALFSPAAGTYHDDGIYLVTARALAEDRGYRIISLPGEPVQTKYPVLFPWLLSLFWRAYPAFPENLPWLRLLTLGSAAAWLVLSWHLLRRLGLSRDRAWVIIALVAASPSVLFFSTSLLSEMPFAALVTAGLLLVARIHDGDARARETWLAGALLGAALLTRSAGLACAAGAVLGLLLQRRWRAAAECAAGVVAAAGAWAWWVSQHAASAVGYVYYSAANYGAWNIVTNYAWAEKLRVLRLNALFFGLAPALFWDIKTSSFWAPIVSVLFFLILGRGVWNARRHPVAMVMVTYLATVMCWAWPPFRFLAPMAPGFAWLVVAGAPKAPNALRALACVIVAALGFQLWNQNLERVEKLTIWPNAGYADSWRLTAPLLEWVMRSTPPNAVLTGNLDPEYFLYTGRKAVRPFSVDAYALYYAPPGANPVGTVEEFRERLRAIGASYLIVTPGVGFGESAPLNRLVTELVAAHPDNLSVVAGSSTSGYVVYEIHRDKLRADRAAVSD